MTDTLAGILSVFCDANSSGEVYNVGNFEEITILDVAERIRKTTQCKSKLVFCPLPADDPREENLT